MTMYFAYKTAYVITEYWYDPLENRNYEGYKPIFISLDITEASNFIAQGGMVAGDSKLVYPTLPNGVPDFNAQPTLDHQMMPKYQMYVIPLLETK